MKQASVSVREVLDELRYGKGMTLPQSQRDITDQTITRIVNYLQAKKGSKQVVPRAPRKSTPLMTLEQWEKGVVYGPLKIDLIGPWVRDNGYSHKGIEELIEEFRTEMIAKEKHYADFAAAFKVYLKKGYLSKRPEQIKSTPNSSKWGNSTNTRGVSL